MNKYEIIDVLKEALDEWEPVEELTKESMANMYPYFWKAINSIVEECEDNEA